MTPLEAFREYLRLSCKLSLAMKQDDIHDLTVRLSAAYAMLSTESQKVAFVVGQEFQELEDGVENDNRVRSWSAFISYIQLSIELSEAVIKHGFGSVRANRIRDYMTDHWHWLLESSREVCGLVNEEFNRLEAMK